jgi:hypothetical protein
MSTLQSELCAVCSKLNLSFRFPPKEEPFEKWLENWEKQRPHYNWREQDRSFEARWKFLQKKADAKIRRLLDNGRWSGSGSDDGSDYSISGESVEYDEDDVSKPEGDKDSLRNNVAEQNVENTDGDDEEADDDDGDGDDVDTDSDGGSDESEALDGENDRFIDALDSGSDFQDYEDARSHLDSSNDEDEERHFPNDPETLSSGEEMSENKDGDEEETELEKKRRVERDERKREKFLRVLKYLDMDPSQYRVENRPNYKIDISRVMRRKSAEGAESEYESDRQSTINNLLDSGNDYVLERSDKKFERGIRDETDTHWANVSLRHRWMLGTSHSITCIVRPGILVLLLLGN